MTLEMMKWDYLEKGREEGLEKGLQQGRKEGREEGREEGLKSGRELEGERYSKLIELLVKDKDYGAFERMTRDETFRKELFEKYRI